MRNKLLFVLAFLAVAVVTIVSCNKGKDIIQHPTYSEFATPVLTSQYYVRNIPNTQFKIPIGLTNVAKTDTKITISDSSRTAVNGTQYTIDTKTITIPAGKATDSVTLKGIYSAYPPGRVDTIYLKITSGDAPLNAYATTYTLIVQGYCDVNINDFVGDYNNVKDAYTSGSWGPYSMDFTINSSTATSADVTLGNVYDYGVPGITTKVHMDWSNPASFSTSIPDQVLYEPDGKWIKADGEGTFSSCNGTITLKYVVYNKSDGSIDTHAVTTMKR